MREERGLEMGTETGTCQHTPLVSSGLVCKPRSVPGVAGSAEWRRGLNREEGLTKKSWPGASVPVPDAECLIWDSAPSQSFRLHPAASEQITG